MTASKQPSPDVEALLLRLDRLEELLEDMEELGVRSADEVEAEIQRIGEQVDELEDHIGGES